MVVGQDWASEDRLRGDVNDDRVRLGYDPHVRTNKNVQRLLNTYFQQKFSDVYATNAFRFIKHGGMHEPIRAAHMKLAAEEFLLPQIRIIQPKIAICLGLSTFNAVREACGLDKVRLLDDAIKAPFDFYYDQTAPRFSLSTFIGGLRGPHQRCTKIIAVAHAGSRGDPK